MQNTKSSVISARKPATKLKTPSTRANGVAIAHSNGEPAIWNHPTHEQIAQLACQLYLESGCQEGRDVENWLRAEQILHPHAALVHEQSGRKAEEPRNNGSSRQQM